MPDFDIIEATETAIIAAEWLTDADKGSVEALRALARKIQAWDQIVDWALDDVALRPGARPKVPENDNVSISAYAKLSDQLGLTPIGRKALAIRREVASDKTAKLHALRGGKVRA